MDNIGNLRDTQSEIKRIKLFQDCVCNANEHSCAKGGKSHAARSIGSNKDRKRNYIHVRINGKPVKAMVDTGNTVETNVAISEVFHKKLGVGFRKQQVTHIGTASKNQKIKKLGISSRIFMRIDGIDKIIGINPCVIKNLSDDDDIWNGFFVEVANKIPCRIEFEEHDVKFHVGNYQTEMVRDIHEQGVIFPAGARALPTGNLEELTGNLVKNSRVNDEFFTKVKLIKE